jgi:hypothetical protein
VASTAVLRKLQTHGWADMARLKGADMQLVVSNMPRKLAERNLFYR